MNEPVPHQRLEGRKVDRKVLHFLDIRGGAQLQAVLLFTLFGDRTEHDNRRQLIGRQLPDLGQELRATHLRYPEVYDNQGWSGRVGERVIFAQKQESFGSISYGTELDILVTLCRRPLNEVGIRRAVLDQKDGFC